MSFFRDGLAIEIGEFPEKNGIRSRNQGSKSIPNIVGIERNQVSDV